MKSSLFVIAALFATTSAIKSVPQDEFIDLQVGVEAQARSNVREMLRNNLRAALDRPAGKSRYDIDAYILPNSEPVEAVPSSNPDVFSAVQVQEQRGDAWPGPILPGSEPIYPIESSPMDVFEPSFVQVSDDELPSVEDARAQAA